VHLVETVVAPLTEVQNEFGLIATLLRLGLRFRYEVIQKYHRALSAALRAKSGNSQAAAELRGHIRNAISVIENDALSRGAENIDRAAVAELFDRDEDQDAIAQVQDDWEQSRLALFTDDPAPGLEAMRDIISAMRDLNYRFMSLSTRRFNEMVSERWRPAGPAH
jgi:cell pole-organizing protein PopZ